MTLSKGNAARDSKEELRNSPIYSTVENKIGETPYLVVSY